MRRAAPFLMFALFLLSNFCCFTIGKLDLDSFARDVIMMEIWPKIENE